ncbi:MAG: hypothetical protein AB7U73_22580 [Pirellulales bacterium]
MDPSLYKFELSPTTWVYQASLLTIAIFFRFNRLASVRNLDLVLIVLLAPGPLLVAQGASLGPQVERWGYLWLMGVGGLLFVRLFVDALLVRRPLLEPNLSPAALTFLGLSLLAFLSVAVATYPVTANDLEGARRADQLLQFGQNDPAAQPMHGPGYPLLHLLAGIPSKALIESSSDLPAAEQDKLQHLATLRGTAIVSHLAIVIGLVVIGYRHFANLRTGIAAAALYLLVPYTALMAGRADHLLPAALLVWAVALYRRPLLAGVFIGLAIGVVYYPAFLLPLWLSFYWSRGRGRFVSGVVVTLLALAVSLLLTSDSFDTFLAQFRDMFRWTTVQEGVPAGFWTVVDPAYRLPVATLLVAMSLSLALWPARKNLGTLISCSAGVMLATQFWAPQEGGLYVAWYLPLLLLTVMRPNLEDRIALTVLSESRFRRRKPQLYVAQAA